MKILFAGTEPGDFRNIVMRNGGKNFLNSFWTLGCGKKSPIPCGDFYLLDSGGYSARVHGFDIDVTEYAKYLNKYKIQYAFNLDVLDLNKSMENLYYLTKNTNTYIMPVYHGGEWIHKETRDLLEYYVDCFPFIALGGIAGKEVSQKNSEKFLSYVFSKTRDKVMVHGLGCTSLNRLKKYPFFCVDSTSWMTMNRFAQSAVYSSEMARVRARNNNWRENLDKDVKYWIKVGEEMTRYWEQRGVKWGELDFEELMAKRKLMTYEEWKEKNGKV